MVAPFFAPGLTLLIAKIKEILVTLIIFQLFSPLLRNPVNVLMPLSQNTVDAERILSSRVYFFLSSVYFILEVADCKQTNAA